MLQGYQSPQDDFQDLDEFLCEYVDGTIDPVVCDALEEYMRMNPRLADHVRELQHTREVLQCYGVRCCKERVSKSKEKQNSDLGLQIRTSDNQGYRTFLSFAVVALVSFALLESNPPTRPFTPLHPPLPAQTSNLSLSHTPVKSLKQSHYFSLFTESIPQPALFASPLPLLPPASSAIDTLETHPTSPSYLFAP